MENGDQGEYHLQESRPSPFPSRLQWPVHPYEATALGGSVPPNAVPG